jgi:hypothetical protein
VILTACGTRWGSLRGSDGTSQSYGGRCSRARLPWSPVARSTSVAGPAATPSLAGHSWQVTAVEFVDKALARARQRAAEQGVEVQWVRGDVGELGRLGLEPGYSLLYDFGCIQGLSDSARRGAAAGLTELAAPGARLLFLAFKAARRIMLPRGMDREQLVALLGNGWDLQHAQSVVTEDMPRRSAGPSRPSTAWPDAPTGARRRLRPRPPAPA